MWFSVILCVSWFLIINVNAQSLGGFCKTPTGESAKCISVYDCVPLISLLRLQSRTQEQTQFLSNSRCGFNSAGVPYVCCGTGFNTNVGSVGATDTNYTPNPSIPDRNQCGWQVQDKIFNGERTSLDEFPWMVLIQYLKSDGTRKFACGGSLINNRYVLTAAHCVTGEVLVKVGQPINVRLGEYDTSSPGRDCFVQAGIRACNQPEINAGIQELVPHSGYTGDNNRYHDIALVRLNREIPFSDYIQPICLPQPSDTVRIGELLTVAGWGRTENGTDSDVKLKLQVPVADSNNCANVFSRFTIRVNDNQLCAGGESGKDSCRGDSGGPLMRLLPTDQTRWMIDGVVSFGYICGTQGYPGVYTRIAKYVPWIHKNVKP